MAQEEMVIFTRTYDFLAWLLPATHHFPRAHRHSFTRRLLDAAFDLSDALEDNPDVAYLVDFVRSARRGPARREQLQRADEALSKLRLYLRLARRLEWFSAAQYEHVAGMVAEIGRLLGGWQKAAA